MTTQYAPPAANLDHPPNETSGITNAIIESLRKTKGWTLLIAICLFLAATLTVVLASVVVFSSMLGDSTNQIPRGMKIGVGAFYLVFAAVYAALGYYLAKYSSAVSLLMRDGSIESMEFALLYQQKFWRLAGVLALLFLVLFIVGFGFGAIMKFDSLMSAQ